MDIKEVTEDMLEQLKKPLPQEALSVHPTKTYLTSIKAIYVTERLTEVFKLGWTLKTEPVGEVQKGMVVVKSTLEVPLYGIYFESFGGNDNGGETNKNFDLGDAYKGATTDSITKIASYMGIGIDVFKGKTKGPTSLGAKPTGPIYVMTLPDVEQWNGKIYGNSVYVSGEKKTISDEQIAKLKAHEKYTELPPKK